jgi:hypothetical protein
MGDDGGAALITTAWNITKDVASLMQNGQHVEMGGRAFALPAGKHPEDLNWEGQADKTLQYTLNWGSTLQELGLSSGTSVRVGVTFDYGGQLDGSGRFLHNAYLWAIPDYIGIGQNFDVNGQFFDAVMEGRTSVLSGVITVNQTYGKVHWSTTKFDVRIKGDGGGYVRRK